MSSDPFYNRKAWKRLRRIKLLQNPLCQECGRPAKDVDHVKAINAGGDALAIENLRSLCHSCHSTKTNYIEKQGRNKAPVKGVDPITGYPVDPEHWWNDEKSLRADAKDRARTSEES